MLRQYNLLLVVDSTLAFVFFGIATRLLAPDVAIAQSHSYQGTRVSQATNVRTYGHGAN